MIALHDDGISIPPIPAHGQNPDLDALIAEGHALRRQRETAEARLAACPWGPMRDHWLRRLADAEARIAANEAAKRARSRRRHA